MHSESSLEFSRSNRRQLEANLSRLDRFYVSELFQETGGHLGILGGTRFSDHAPISITILQEKRQIRITDAIIKEKRSREHLTGI